MNITATAVAVTLAVIIAVAFLFFGPNILRPFGNQAMQTATTTDAVNLNSMATTSDTTNPQAGIPQQLPTKLTITDVVVGTGAEAKSGDLVTVTYVGALPDGTIFDASASHPETKGGFVFPLGGGRVIKGWDQGIVGMKVGGKRRLIIPPDMAYGAQGAGGVIPPNATLLFEVELVKIGQ